VRQSVSSSIMSCFAKLRQMQKMARIYLQAERALHQTSLRIGG